MYEWLIQKIWFGFYSLCCPDRFSVVAGFAAVVMRKIFDQQQFLLVSLIHLETKPLFRLMNWNCPFKCNVRMFSVVKSIQLTVSVVDVIPPIGMLMYDWQQQTLHHRKVLLWKHFQYSHTGGNFRHTYARLYFHEVVYTRYLCCVLVHGVGKLSIGLILGHDNITAM
jgi:hypothetical protein